VDEAGGYVAENYRVVILRGLIGYCACVAPIHRIEPVLSDIRNPSRLEEKEMLHGNEVDRVDHGVAIYIRGGQSASGQWRSYQQEMPLDRDQVHGVNSLIAWRKRSLAWCHSVVSALG
jgi:hypothetical protein